MDKTSPRPTMFGPVAALVLAVGAVASFGASDAMGFLSDSAEGFFVIAWLVGWALLAWAVIVAGGSLVALIRRARARRPVSRFELALLGASLALVVFSVSTHPLWGWGWGSGSDT